MIKPAAHQAKAGIPGFLKLLLSIPCVCVCVCVHACACPRLLIASGVLWHDMDHMIG